MDEVTVHLTASIGFLLCGGVLFGRMDNGWIKIHRKITGWEWYNVSEMFHLFMHLLLLANHKESRWQGVEVERGQLITGRKQLSVETGISEQTIRTCLERLQNSGEINIRATSKFSIITICNYDNYQVSENKINQPTNQQLTIRNEPLFALNADEVEKINQPTNQQKNTANPTEVGVYDNKTGQTNQQTNQQLTNNQPTTNQQLTTNKNVKNVKEVYTYNSFYDAELKNSDNDPNYKTFIEFIFGKNELGEPLRNVLKLKQVTYEQFKGLWNKKLENNISLSQYLVQMENYKPLVKNNQYVSRTLHNWINRDLK